MNQARNDILKTVDEAVQRLMSDLSLKDKNTIANMDEADLINLHFSLGLSIRNKVFSQGMNNYWNHAGLCQKINICTGMKQRPL